MRRKQSEDIVCGICARCHDRIEPDMYRLIREFCSRKGLPERKPKLCAQCLSTAIERIGDE